jgi:hypothetical protein
MSNEKTTPQEAVQELADEAARQGEEAKPAAGQIQVNLDTIRKTKVLIAMPCYGGMLTESVFTSFIKWANTAKQYGIEWSVETMVNESLISRARNTLTAKFLENKDMTHLMFIDADIGWEPWHLMVMLSRDVDVIGGLYPMKTLPIKWCVNGVENGIKTADGLQEVSKTGTGFLLIKREVFEKMNAHPAVKPYKNDIGLDPKYDKHLKTYFDTAVRQGRYYSEDWLFCENHRDLGGQVFVDTRVQLRHSGHYTFCQENQNALVDTMGPIYVEKLKADALADYEKNKTQE